ncbi:hypothetical protein Zmor_026046 [Zophobas morio]|uniref:Uncharacterized protein n=1 Tax=Zophobas morio TaxID=2755281 RepID=A0AA38M5P1_9CUCU|nr:hypothetical protein Zmor_026046 [Zophobas morio]
MLYTRIVPDSHQTKLQNNRNYSSTSFYCVFSDVKLWAQLAAVLRKYRRAGNCDANSVALFCKCKTSVQLPKLVISAHIQHEQCVTNLKYSAQRHSKSTQENCHGNAHTDIVLTTLLLQQGRILILNPYFYSLFMSPNK